MAKQEILIRCIGIANQKVKLLKPAIANNKQLMKTMGWVISDPRYEEKMDCIKNRKPFSENGQAKEPVKESFASPIESPKQEPKIEQPKNEISAPEIKGEVKAKRIRRTKAQIEADNKSKKTVTA